MSIFPARIKYLYGNCYSAFYEERLILEKMDLKCCVCGKPVKNTYGWVDHSITFGYGNAWCTKKCLRTAKLGMHH